MSAPQPLRFERNPDAPSRSNAIRSAQMYEFGATLMGAIQGALVDVQGMPKDEADYVAYEVLRRVMETCGGSYVYVPKGFTLGAHEREQAMWAEYDGRNIHELAKKYKVGVIHAYAIIRRARLKHQASKQPCLFGARAQGNNAP